MCLNGIEIHCFVSRRYRLPVGAIISLDIIEVAISIGSVIVEMFYYHFGEISQSTIDGFHFSKLFAAQRWIAVLLAFVIYFLLSNQISKVTGADFHRYLELFMLSLHFQDVSNAVCGPTEGVERKKSTVCHEYLDRKKAPTAHHAGNKPTE